MQLICQWIGFFIIVIIAKLAIFFLVEKQRSGKKFVHQTCLVLDVDVVNLQTIGPSKRIEFEFSLEKIYSNQTRLS